MLNFCANNYLGLSSHPVVLEAAKAAIDSHGFGMSSVRFICGTQDIHKKLESKILYILKFSSFFHRLILSKKLVGNLFILLTDMPMQLQ